MNNKQVEVNKNYKELIEVFEKYVGCNKEDISLFVAYDAYFKNEKVNKVIKKFCKSVYELEG